MENTAYYLNKMKEDFSQRQRLNPHYSLRAYARDIGIHSATLCQVFKGKRALPIKHSKDVANKLKLGPKERTFFLESLYKTKTNLDQITVDPVDTRVMLDESHFKVLAEWEHYAVLTLFDLDQFVPSISEIASRLNILPNRAEVVLNNLISSGLLKYDEHGKIIKSKNVEYRTTEDITSTALKLSHLETLEMGKNKLEEIDLELRDFSSMTIAMDLERMPEVKTIIREFRQKMAALLREGKKTDVCQMSIQFYPLTTINKE